MMPVTAPNSYPSLVLGGLMSEAEFFRFLATYAVPDDPANAIPALRQRWRASREAYGACGDPVFQDLADWEQAWGDPADLLVRPGVRSLLQDHPELRPCAAPVSGLVVVHPSLDLEQADTWAARLAGAADLAVPPTNDAAVAFSLEEDCQRLEVHAAYALLGAYLSADTGEDSVLPRVGVHWQPGINVIQVGRLGDRLVLINGHHRAYALARAGASLLPCVGYDLQDLSGVGAEPGDGTDQAIRSTRPPTLLDFLDPALAVPVLLRRSIRVVTLDLSEKTIQARA
jgi:hypothetical protein